ncbi:hypothetical protein B0J13DRAFT_218359 [Dactylonectria estremocensis]|uniref:Uncharacterized protein n=1 Tax=Dactylonectria estremocensis TaxID=1079267 RepID=A0A9P9F6P9_9HYPO|nr:hypothetical protein B0J13DRAFT_218359 [Dactylonectria estremocensis]
MLNGFMVWIVTRNVHAQAILHRSMLRPMILGLLFGIISAVRVVRVDERFHSIINSNFLRHYLEYLHLSIHYLQSTPDSGLLGTITSYAIVYS